MTKQLLLGELLIVPALDGDFDAVNLLDASGKVLFEHVVEPLGRRLRDAHNLALSALRREVEELRDKFEDREYCVKILLERSELAEDRLATAEAALSQLQDINNPMHFGLHPPKAMLDSHELATNTLNALRGARKAKDSEGPSFEELKLEDQEKIRRQQQ